MTGKPLRVELNRARWFAPLWLVYLGLPAFYTLELPLGQAALGLSLLAVFAGLYLLSFWRQELAFYNGVGMLAITAGLCFLLDSMVLTLGFFTVALASFGLEGKQRWLLNLLHAGMAAAVLFVLGPNMDKDEWLNLVPPLIVIVVFPLAARAVRRSRELRQELDTANERIKELIQKEERERIARDLHDTLGQTLTLISLKSELAERLMTKKPEQAKEEVAEIRRSARSALKQIRELVTDMQALRLTEQLHQAERVLQSAGIRLTVVGEREVKSLPSVIGHVLAFCVRETVTNVVRHSRASVCEIRFERGSGEMKLMLKDDGIGFESDLLKRTEKEGNGLRNMKERLEFIGGDLQSSCGEEGGACVVMTVPLKAHEDDSNRESDRRGTR